MQELIEPTYPYESLKQPRPLLVILSGPSGVGKDTVMAGLREAGVPFYQVVTAATRPRRPDEQDGLDYHFVSKERFAEMIERKELLEHAVVYGDYKGIPKEEVRKGLHSGLDVVLRIDVQGAATLRRMVPQAVAIFLVASSEEEMVKRLHERKTEEAWHTCSAHRHRTRGAAATGGVQIRGRQPRGLPRRDRAPGDQHHDRRALPGRLGAGAAMNIPPSMGQTSAPLPGQTIGMRIPLHKPRWTFVLLGINIAIFAAMTLFGALNGLGINGTQNSGPARVLRRAANQMVAQGDFYRLFTSMFIHIGLIHLLFNSYALYVVGQDVERLYGAGRFLVIYFLSGLGGSLVSYVFGNRPCRRGPAARSLA